MADINMVFAPWPKGTRFIIRNNNLKGEEVVEGVATIQAAIDPDNNLYEVEFEKEPGTTYQRRVNGGDMVVYGGDMVISV